MAPESEKKRSWNDDNDEGDDNDNPGMGKVRMSSERTRATSPYPIDTCKNQPSRSCSVQSVVMIPQEIEAFGIEIPRTNPPKDRIPALQ